MDFRDWKKISEDKKSCVLEHPKGHKLTVAIKGLSSIHREQLKRLKMKDGGEVKHYAQGTDPVVSSDNTTSTDQPNGTNITINAAPAVTPQSPEQNLPPMATAVNPATQMARQPVQTTVPNPVQGESDVSGGGQVNPAAINRNLEKSAQAQRDVDIAQAKADAQNVNQYGQALGNLQQYDQNKFNDMAAHTQAFAEYNAKNPINEKHYVENMGAAGKTATALGIMIGGLGTPFGGHNVAYDYLNKQIDRDIEGQKSRADQQKTIYGAYKDLYGEGREASAAAKATMLDIYNNKAKNIALKLGTPRAWANYLKFNADTLSEKQKTLKEGAVPINSLPGANGSTSQSPENNERAPQSETARKDRILSPDAQKKYDWSMSPYNNVQSPEEKASIQKEYKDAFQVDKALDQIDELFPELQKKATLGGFLANKVNPTTIGGIAGMGAEALGALAAPETGGASLLAAVPAAAGAAGAGYAIGSGLKTGLRAMGGQQETQYETARDALRTIISSALGASGQTPSAIGEIADEFIPTKFDSDETAQNKLTKLKQKIVSIAKTATLKSKKMTND